MKHFIRTLSVILAVLMAALTPLQVFAEANETKYISEIVTVEAGSFKEAKTALEAAGYKAVDGNLNGTLGVGIYLGYKETADKKEAITDIAAMNMLGKFSYSDYKQIMDEYEENIEETLEDIETFIEEFQLGYANETKNALMAYDALNMFKDDDSGSLMGDYFLDYDFSDASHQSMTDTLMQANSDIVMSMIRALSFAGDPDETTLIDRMSALGPGGLEKKYADSFPTHAAFENAMAKQYGAAADTLYKDWDYFFNYLNGIEENIVAVDGDELEIKEDALESSQEPLDTVGMSDEVKELVEELENEAETPEIIDNTTDFEFYTLLADTIFGEGTLLDFFKRPSSEIDKSELYVLVECMSDGQKKQVDYLGIKEILQGVFSADEETGGEESEAVEQYRELAAMLDTVSIFEGVDRSVFEDGVAFTSDAVNHESLSGESWLGKLGYVVTPGTYWNKSTVICWAATCGLAIAGITATLVRNSALKKLPAAEEALEAAKQKYSEEYDKILTRWDGGSPAYSVEQNMAILDDMFPQYRWRLDDCVDRYHSVQRTVKIAGAVKVASFVLLAVILVFDVYTVVDYFMQDDPTEEAIPHHMMATAMTAYGEDYVYYQTVKTVDGEAADVNAHKADPKTGWLVLYTTKDANAGDAICADNINVHIGDTNFGDACAAHLFNEEAALNTTAAIYTGVDDTVGGTYILFDRSDSALTGSAISGGTAALIAAGGFVLGGALGSIITALAKKKKKNEADA